MGHGAGHATAILPPGPLSVHVHLWSVEVFKLTSEHTHSLSTLSVYSPDEDSCQKFVPFIGVRIDFPVTDRIVHELCLI